MQAYLDKSLEAQKRAEDLLSLLSLREKVGQLNQTLYGFQSYEREEGKAVLTESFREACRHWGGLGVFYGLYRSDPWTQKDYDSGLNRREMVELYNEAQRIVIEQSRFSIPVLFSQESPHGPVSLDGYLLPVNLAAGASFNPDLFREACSIAGRELNDCGVHLSLVSMLDVLRDARWGRCEECFSEDPFLSAEMAKAAVIGYREGGTAVVGKHFAAQGEGTGGINASSARIGERELREIHVPPMKAIADAGVAGVMAAYNEIDGVFCHQNPWLLKTLLRDELGFDGIVMADGIAIDNLNSVTGDPVESAAAALRSGVDVSLWDQAFTKLEEACRRYPELIDRINEACLRVLSLKFSSGLFDQPFLAVEEAPVYTVSEYPASLELAKESIVLLKNDKKLLPLDPDKIQRLAVIGPHVRDVYTLCGDYTPYLKAEQCRSIADGMAEYTEVFVEEGSGITSRNGQALEQAVHLAREADAVVLTLGGSSSRFGESSFAANGALSGTLGDVDCGEGVDVADVSLTQAQLELFEVVRAVTSSRAIPLVTVIVGGRPYAIPSVAEQTDALLYSFYPGPMGGKALADIVFGTSPAGRLPVSLPRSNTQIPLYYNVKASYKQRYADLDATPLYGFGEGLTYTDFELKSVSCSASEIRAGETLSIDCELANVGEREAAAVLQLYIRETRSSRVPRVRELKAFKKQSIQAGGTADIRLDLAAEDLKVWSVAGEWQLETGRLHLEIKDQGKLLWEGEIQILAG